MKPLPRTIFSESQVEEAFRYFGTGKHWGKILIKIRTEEPNTLRNPTRTISAEPKIFFNPKKSYIITGGLGGVGLELTNWMIKKGAKKIILNSRRGVASGYQKLCLKKWSTIDGVQVQVSTDDSSNIQQANKLITEAESVGAIGGMELIFQ